MAHAPALDTGMSRAEYDALVLRGVLEEAYVELIEGRLYAMTRQSPEHACVIQTLTMLLAPAVERLDVQLPLAASQRSEPEPDLALTDRSAYAHPTTARLVIEVVVTQWREAMRKLPVYAEASVGECWIVDVPKRQVLVHDQPAGRTYARTRSFENGDVLTPPGTDIRFTAADVFARLDG